MFHVLKLNARGKKCEREIARLATKQCSSVPIVLSIYLLLLFHNEAFLFTKQNNMATKQKDLATKQYLTF